MTALRASRAARARSPAARSCAARSRRSRLGPAAMKPATPPTQVRAASRENPAPSIEDSIAPVRRRQSFSPARRNETRDTRVVGFLSAFERDASSSRARASLRPPNRLSTVFRVSRDPTNLPSPLLFAPAFSLKKSKRRLRASLAPSRFPRRASSRGGDGDAVPGPRGCVGGSGERGRAPEGLRREGARGGEGSDREPRV